MVDEIKEKLNKKLENSEVLAHREVAAGVHELEIDVGPKGRPVTELAYLTGKDGERSPLRFHEGGRVVTRDFLRRVDLDLMSKSPVTRMKPDKIYQQAINYYRTKGHYGTIVDTLSNFAAKGFKNDIDDLDIKLFYDTWGSEINFQETVEKVFFDFFRVGLVRTFKIVGKFDPKLKPENFQSIVKGRKAKGFKTSSSFDNVIAHSEWAAAKKIWSKAFVPLNYTILDPTMIDIQGSLLFDQTETFLKPEAFKDVREMLKSQVGLSQEQKKFLNSLPKELKEDIKKNKPVKLPSELVGKCDYRKQDYERYPMPKVARAFDHIDYKEELRKADFSTLDGITNYILKITIGNDEHPVTEQSQLEAVASLFDTSSKSFDVVWNHTLQVEKITFPEIDKILGQDKFKQVNDDISQTFGVSRAFIDGQVTGNSKAIEIGVKAFAEEVNYARRCVKRWIDNEYEEIALAMGFDRYPQVRFDENAVKDEIMMMSVIQGMIDRRIISYETGIEKLGLDFNTELANFIQEKPLVLDGVLGIIGSPYNPKAIPAQQAPVQKDTTPSGKDSTVTQKDLDAFQKNVEKMLEQNIQKIQRTPTGTPSEGRPRTGGKGKPRQKGNPRAPKPTKPQKS